MNVFSRSPPCLHSLTQKLEGQYTGKLHWKHGLQQEGREAESSVPALQTKTDTTTLYRLKIVELHTPHQGNVLLFSNHTTDTYGNLQSIRSKKNQQYSRLEYFVVGMIIIPYSIPYTPHKMIYLTRCRNYLNDHFLLANKLTAMREQS